MSLGLPGIGWVVAALTLVLTSFLVPWIGRKYVTVTLGISVIHVLTFGPLSLLGQSRPVLPTFFLIVFVIAPIVIALISLFFPIERFRTKRE